MPKMYTVHMYNFDITKGSFDSIEEAIECAKATGFQCSIWAVEEGKQPLHICKVNP